MVQDFSNESENVFVLTGCPCYTEIEGESFCNNGSDHELKRVFRCDVDQGLLEIMMDSIPANDGLCFFSLFLGADDMMYCASQKIPINLKGHALNSSLLELALRILQPLIKDRESNCCHECMYKLLTLFHENK